MRIKKKHILESAEEINKAAELSVSSTEDLKNAFKDIGVEDDNKAADLAANVVNSAIGDGMNEEDDREKVHTKKFDRCVAAVEKDSDVDNPYAVCQDSLGADAIKKSHQTKPESQYEGIDPGTGEDFGDIPTGRDLEVDADDYEEYQNLLKQVSSGAPTIDLDSVEDGLPFESVRPRMTKSELMETVKNIGENHKNPRKVIKTFKVKDLRK